MLFLANTKDKPSWHVRGIVELQHGTESEFKTIIHIETDQLGGVDIDDAESPDLDPKVVDFFAVKLGLQENSVREDEVRLAIPILGGLFRSVALQGHICVRPPTLSRGEGGASRTLESHILAIQPRPPVPEIRCTGSCYANYVNRSIGL